MKKLIVAVVVACGFLGGTFLLSNSPTEDEVMHDFYEAKNRSEEMLMDPLILNAEIVSNRVIKEIADKQMNKRRYAISFLGNEKVEDALPTLREILKDGSEKDYFRGGALESIFQISSTEGKELSERYKNRSDYLGRVAKGLIDGTWNIYERTHFQALSSYKE